MAVQCATEWADATCCPEDIEAAFVWQGPWMTGTTYAVNAAVALGGSTYVCIRSHTSDPAGGPFVNRPDIDIGEENTTGTYWDTMALGGQAINWRGAWDAGTIYVTYDAVEYLGSSWITEFGAGAGVVPSVSEPAWSLMAEAGDDGGGFLYTWDAGGAAPPGDMQISLNGAPNAATAMYIDIQDVYGQDRTNDLLAWDTDNLGDQGTILVEVAGTAIASWQYQTVTNQTDYIEYALVQNTANPATITDNTSVRVTAQVRGNRGLDAGTPYLFSEQTGDPGTPPISGVLRLDTATASTVAKMFIYETTADVGGGHLPVGDWIASWGVVANTGARGVLYLSEIGATENFLTINVTGAVTGPDAGVYTVPVSVEAETNDDITAFWSGGEGLRVAFTPAGVDGADGVTAGDQWTYSNSLLNPGTVDPASGEFMFDALPATVGQTLLLAVSDNTAAAADVSAWVVSWQDGGNTNDRGTLDVKLSTAPDANFVKLTITGTADIGNAGYTVYNATVAALDGTLTPAASCGLAFSRAGDGVGGTVDSVGVQRNATPAGSGFSFGGTNPVTGTGTITLDGTANSVDITDGAVTTAKLPNATGAADGVTYAKLQHAAALSVLGRSANSLGVLANIVAGTDGHVLMRKLNGASALTFALVEAANLADAAVTYAKIQNAVADNVFLGNNNGADSDFEELAADAAMTILDTAADAVARQSDLTGFGDAFLAVDQAWTGTQRSAFVATDLTIDLSLGQNFVYTQAAADELSFVNIVDGVTGVLKVIKDGTNGLTTAAASISWGSAGIPTELSGTEAGTHYVSYVADATLGKVVCALMAGTVT